MRTKTVSKGQIRLYNHWAGSRKWLAGYRAIQYFAKNKKKERKEEKRKKKRKNPELCNVHRKDPGKSNDWMNMWWYFSFLILFLYHHKVYVTAPPFSGINIQLYCLTIIPPSPTPRHSLPSAPAAVSILSLWMCHLFLCVWPISLSTLSPRVIPVVTSGPWTPTS